MQSNTIKCLSVSICVCVWALKGVGGRTAAVDWVFRSMISIGTSSSHSNSSKRIEKVPGTFFVAATSSSSSSNPHGLMRHILISFVALRLVSIGATNSLDIVIQTLRFLFSSPALLIEWDSNISSHSIKTLDHSFHISNCYRAIVSANRLPVWSMAAVSRVPKFLECFKLFLLVFLV